MRKLAKLFLQIRGGGGGGRSPLPSLTDFVGLNLIRQGQPRGSSFCSGEHRRTVPERENPHAFRQGQMRRSRDRIREKWGPGKWSLTPQQAIPRGFLSGDHSLGSFPFPTERQKWRSQNQLTKSSGHINARKGKTVFCAAKLGLRLDGELPTATPVLGAWAPELQKGPGSRSSKGPMKCATLRPSGFQSCPMPKYQGSSLCALKCQALGPGLQMPRFR